MLELEEKTIQFIRTKIGKLGVPCLWENSVTFPDMSRITKIFNKEGDEISPIYFSTKNGTALVPIREKDLIVKIFIEKDNTVGITILRILDIDKYSNGATVEVVKRKGTTDIDFNDNAKVSEKLESNTIEKIMNYINNKESK